MPFLLFSGINEMMSIVKECLLSINEWKVASLFERLLNIINDFMLSLSFKKRRIYGKEVVIIDCFLFQRMWMRIFVYKSYIRIRINGAYRGGLKKKLCNMNAKRVMKKTSYVAFSVNEVEALNKIKKILNSMYRDHIKSMIMIKKY